LRAHLKADVIFFIQKIYNTIRFKAAYNQFQPFAMEKIAADDLGAAQQILRSMGERDVLPMAEEGFEVGEHVD